MKKVLSIIVTVVAMLAIATSTVNASGISVDKAEIEKGGTAVVTFSTTEAGQIQFDLKYDSSKFEVSSVSSDNSNATIQKSNLDANTLRVVFIDFMMVEKVSKINVTFTAKADAEGAADFTVSNVVLDPADEVTTATASVEIKAGAETPVTPAEPEKTDKPTHLNQTGTPVVAIVASIAVVLVAAVAVRKIVK